MLHRTSKNVSRIGLFVGLPKYEWNCLWFDQWFQFHQHLVCFCVCVCHHPKITWQYTLSPIIMEVENYPKWKETNIGGTHFPLPWLWEEGYTKVSAPFPDHGTSQCKFSPTFPGIVEKWGGLTPTKLSSSSTEIGLSRGGHHLGLSFANLTPWWTSFRGAVSKKNMLSFFKYWFLISIMTVWCWEKKHIFQQVFFVAWVPTYMFSYFF